MDRYVEANGIRIHLIDHGGEGPVLVLAPGLTSNCHVFDGLVANGLASGVHALAFDLRGRGESDRPSTGYRLADHAADVIGALDVLGIDRVIMGGHSYGGMLSFWIAANYPERVIACVTLDPPADVNSQVREQVQPAVDRLRLVLPSAEAYLEAAKAMPYYKGWWDPLIENYFHADLEATEGGVRHRSRVEDMGAVLEDCEIVDWESVVRAVSHPTLLIRATDPYGPPGASALLPGDLAELTMSRLGDVRMVEVEANHMTMLFGDAANQTVAAILDFVEGV